MDRFRSWKRTSENRVMDLFVSGLSKSFTSKGLMFGPRRTVQAALDIQLRVNAGQSLGVVGESGSGKTTVAKILAGFLTADAGTAALGGKNLMSLPKRERAKLVQMVFQDPFASLNPKLLLGTQLMEALMLRSRDDRPARAIQLMQDVGLPADFLKRYPHQLSGGQRQRFAIARALAAEPSLLLADEPVSSLDLSVQAQIINLLNALRAKRGFTQVVISHDLAVIANTCDSLIVMKEGRIVEEGPVEVVLSKPSHPYTQRLLAAAPV